MRGHGHWTWPGPSERRTFEDTRHAVQEAALRIAQSVAGPETQELAAKLEKATRCSIVELAVHAEQWPD
jgi:hypothetical protein